MPILVVQYTLSAVTATNLLSPAFTNRKGAAADPIPLIIKNEDSSITVWIGGQNVSPTTGQSLGPGGSIPMALYNSDVPYAIANSGSPILSVMVGRQ